jgi:hypothetical protein
VRIALGFVIAAASLALAVRLHAPRTKLHGHVVATSCKPVPSLFNGEAPTYPCGSSKTTGFDSYTEHSHGGWQTPLAIFIAVAGIGVGVAIVVPALRR